MKSNHNMNRTVTVRLAALASIVAVVLVAGCKKEDAHSDHDGHKHGSTQADPGTVARCAKHQAPKELCFICDPGLRDKGRLWCKEHDRYEDRCWLCHPELEDKQRKWCKDHSLYEDECFLCRPDLQTKPQAVVPSGTSMAALMCKEHGVPEAECGICHPDLAGQLKPGDGLKVRLPSPDSAALAGVRTGKATVGGLGDGINCLAELAFNQNKLAQIVASVGGIVQEVSVDLGNTVDEKQVVVRIWSAAIAETVARAVLTHQTLERERKLRAGRVTSEQDLQRAEAEHRAACQQARTLGFSEEDIDAFGTRPEEPVYLEVRAPFAGEIIERTVVRGALIEAGKPLFTLADRATMWAMLNIPEAELGRVRAGQTVELQVDSIPGRAFIGKLTWIAAEVDERSRMARARAELPNPDGAFKARMFARARILTGNADGALVLPAAAVQQVEGRSLVFVKLAEDLFQARAVRLGTRYNGQLEVLEGLHADEHVVLAGSFPLKSQLLISRLGAGCADE
ncbi:MAG: efflux RND transporter periplasmic adaptor subunit [Verrucomicrobia bacterium]|nr:efflux RND transporter periplasmic adaptor subunit [Verrucomicrobiota bacterium]